MFIKIYSVGDVSKQWLLHNNIKLIMDADSNVPKQGLQHALGARCSSVGRAFAHGLMGRQINPLWGGPIELNSHSFAIQRLLLLIFV